MLMALIRLIDHAFPAPTGAPGPARRVANTALSAIALVLIIGTLVILAGPVYAIFTGTYIK